MDARDHIRDAFGRHLNRTTPHSGACLDCDADLTIRETSPGVFHAVIEHDATCPSYQAMRRDGDTSGAR